MKKIKIGDKFKNFKEEIHEVINISKTGLVLICKNSETCEIVKFRFYEASGRYIKKDTVVDLGNLI